MESNLGDSTQERVKQAEKQLRIEVKPDEGSTYEYTAASSHPSRNIHRACKLGKMDEIKSILAENRLSAIETGMWGNTPLMIAFQGQHGQLIDLLINEYKDIIEDTINTTNERGCSVLLYACVHGTVDQLNKLLSTFKSIEIDCLPSTSVYNPVLDKNTIATPLSVCCSNNLPGHLHLLLIHLLNESTTASTINYVDRTFQFQTVSILPLLSSKQYENIQGQTMFMTACYYGSFDICKALINLGANTSIQDEYGNTALHYLMQCQFVHSPPEQPAGSPVPFTAIEKRSAIIIGILDLLDDLSFSMIKDSINNSGLSILHCAVEQYMVSVCEYLLSRGCSINSPMETSISKPLLHVAIRKLSTKIVEMLVNSYEADIYVKDQNGDTALSKALLLKENHPIRTCLMNAASKNQSNTHPVSDNHEKLVSIIADKSEVISVVKELVNQVNDQSKSNQCVDNISLLKETQESSHSLTDADTSVDNSQHQNTITESLDEAVVESEQDILFIESQEPALLAYQADSIHDGSMINDLENSIDMAQERDATNAQAVIVHESNVQSENQVLSHVDESLTNTELSNHSNDITPESCDKNHSLEVMKSNENISKDRIPNTEESLSTENKREDGKQFVGSIDQQNESPSAHLEVIEDVKEVPENTQTINIEAQKQLKSVGDVEISSSDCETANSVNLLQGVEVKSIENQEESAQTQATVDPDANEVIIGQSIQNSSDSIGVKKADDAIEPQWESTTNVLDLVSDIARQVTVESDVNISQPNEALESINESIKTTLPNITQSSDSVDDQPSQSVPLHSTAPIKAIDTSHEVALSEPKPSPPNRSPNDRKQAIKSLLQQRRLELKSNSPTKSNSSLFSESKDKNQSQETFKLPILTSAKQSNHHNDQLNKEKRNVIMNESEESSVVIVGVKVPTQPAEPKPSNRPRKTVSLTAK